MKLPVLQTESQTRTSCDGGKRCFACSLYTSNGGRCSGCSPAHRLEMGRVFPNFVSCYQECNTCTGYKVKVPTVCCRSPMTTAYMTAVTKGASDWNKPEYTYTARPKLEFQQRAVFYISSGGVNTIAPGKIRLVDDSHEIVAVNLTRVWSGNGFYSRDLKDYLHLSPKTKLVLMTMCLDDLLERAFTKELYTASQEYTRVGLDAWMPLSFSAYPEEAHMHQYYQTLRTLYCTEKSHAWFVTGDHKLPGLNTDDLILRAAKSIPQMVFNMQFVEDRWFVYHMQVLKHYNALLPANVSFWIVGSSTPKFMANVRAQVGKRHVYYISAKPLYLAAKGKLLRADGGSDESELGKKQLLDLNFAQFAKTVKDYG